MLTDRISALSEVFWTVTMWDPGLCNRLAGRRRDRRASTFFYRRTDGCVFILADKLIGGSTDPTWCATMTPSEALEWLIPAMWIPGHEDHGFSDGWKVQHENVDGLVGTSGQDDSEVVHTPDNPAEDAIPASISVTHLSDAQVTATLAEFRVETYERYDVDFDIGVIPRSMRLDLVKLLHSMLDRSGA